MSPTLATRILQGDVRAAGRLMRWVDDGDPRARHELAALFPHTGGAYLVGITGNPGSGKSTLVNQLIGALRAQGLTVGCVAVDPTSPFSGGAILGDRVRMQQHALDPGVFIRSVATRGNLGGISRSTPALVQILDAMGFDVILIETVGVGQDEVDIARLADTNLVVNVPGLGDEVQAEKAGILEIADIFVINKADLPGADRLQRELRTMLNLREKYTSSEWKPIILRTVATSGEGVGELLDKVFEHRTWFESHHHDVGREFARLEQLVRLIVAGELTHRLESALATDHWQDTLDALKERKVSPYDACDALLSWLSDH